MFLPVLTAVIGGVWVVWQFTATQSAEAERAAHTRLIEAQTQRDEAEKAAQTRLIEAQKPFLDKQLELYLSIAKTVGILVTTKVDPSPNSPWDSAKHDFFSLFWAQLPMVENPDVETAMVNLRDALKGYEDAFPSDYLKPEVEKRAYCLGHAIRKSVQDSWKVSVGAGQIPQQLFQTLVIAAPVGTPPSTSPDPKLAAEADQGCNSKVRTK